MSRKNFSLTEKKKMKNTIEEQKREELKDADKDLQ